VSLPRCDVIVPTQALAQRGALLREALHSILTQEGVQARPLIIINGGEADPALRDALEHDPRCRVAVLPVASLPAALRAGRRLVEAPWFTELDDDDFLLPGALAARLELLTAHDDCDAVVTNGFWREAETDLLHVRDAAAVHRDPLRAMMRGNWLLPGSWLCRTATVGPELFEAMPSYRETTYLGIRFATAYRMRFLDRPTVVHRRNTPGSLSGARAYLLGGAPALDRILALELPVDVRVVLQRHLADAQHVAAELRAGEGAFRDAWLWHFRSLRGRGGWRYLPFTAHMLRAWWSA
jgi:glycosyltransferase involved in cell wall biosynthesis